VGLGEHPLYSTPAIPVSAWKARRRFSSVSPTLPSKSEKCLLAWTLSEAATARKRCPIWGNPSLSALKANILSRSWALASSTKTLWTFAAVLSFILLGSVQLLNQKIFLSVSPQASSARYFSYLSVITFQ